MKRLFILILFVYSICESYEAVAQAPYCTSYAISDGTYDIIQIEIKQGATIIFSNSSTCGATNSLPGSMAGQYTNYRHQIINLIKGQTYTLNVTNHSCGHFFNSLQFAVMYLDLNKNFVFDTPSERLVRSLNVMLTVPGSVVHTANFTIPSSTNIDSTVMRITAATAWSTFPYPCGILYSNGETEDYTVSFCEPVTRNLTLGHPRCWGDTTGKIKLSASGGRAPLQYAWNGGSYGTLDSLVNKPAGTYTLITRDSLGCKHYDTILLTQPSPLVLTKKVDSSCNNTPTGKITLTGSGGKPSYRYQLGSSGFDTTRTWTGLSSGIYNIALRDSHFCVRTDTLYIDTFPQYPLFKSIDTIACRSQKGNIYLRSTAIDSSLYRRYSYNGGAFLPTLLGGYYANFTLDSGMHIVILRDKHGCLRTDTTHLSAPPPTVLTLQSIQHLGCNGKKGILWVQRSGGNPTLTYDYFWSHIGGYTYKDSFHNLDTGQYLIQVRDNLGCDTTKLRIRIEDRQTNITVGHTLAFPYKCTYDSINRIQIVPFGGVNPYQYSIAHYDYYDPMLLGTLPPFSSKDTATIKNSPSDGLFYVYVRVKDSNQCQKDTILSIYPQSIAYLSATPLQTFYCVGDTIQIRVDTFLTQYTKLPLQYSLLGSPYQTSTLFKIETPNYSPITLFYTDNIGCTGRYNIVLSAKPEIRALYSQQNNNCRDSSLGSISINAWAGTPPLQYRLNGGSFGSTTNFTQLKAGNYTVEIKDDIGCKKINNLTITQPTITCNINILSPIKCYGDSNASIRIVFASLPAGGTPLYSLNGSTYQSNAVYTQLRAGNYTLRIQYNGICYYDTSFTITQPSKLQANFSANNLQLPCYKSKLGSIQLNPIGGISPYSLILNQQTQPLGTIQNLGSGSYVVQLRDANQCIDTAQFIFTEPPKLQIDTIEVVHPSCFAASSGKISLIATGGTAPIMALWNTGDTLWTRYNLSQGIYKIKAKDKNGCLDSISLTLSHPNQLEIESLVVQPKCYGYTDGSISIVSKGGTQPHTYQWENGSSSPLRTNLSKGNYFLTLTDAKNCSKADSFSLVYPLPLTAQIQTQSASCYNTPDGLVEISPSGGTISGNKPYNISFNAQLPKPVYIYPNLLPGNYAIRVLDNRDCFFDTVIQIHSPERISMTIDSVYTLSEIGERVQLNPQSNHTNYEISYLWHPAEGLSCVDCLKPLFQGYINKKYTLVYSYNQDKCSDSIHTRVQVPLLQNSGIYIPSAFSPNGIGDTENESFKVYGNHIVRIHLIVFNRWGEKVFETRDKEIGWNGLYKGEASPAETYSYTAKIWLLDGQIVEKTGTIHLIR